MVPPMPKHRALSIKGGTGAEPMVKSASSDHIKMAENPTAVAFARVMLASV
jgi:hypothetical protein